MIRPRTLPLGPLQPDLAAILNASGLRAANNVLPTKSGYEPMLALADIGENAITLRPRGGISGTDRANNPWNYVGQADKIYEIASSGTRDASKVGGYSCTGTERWAFAEFGTVVIATSFNDPLQYIDTAAPLGTYADVPELSPGVGVPRGRRIGVVENHVILGDCYDAVYGAVPDSIWWGAIKQPLSYPEINSDLAASLQSDRQPLRGEGGPVQAVIGGAEVGAIFQERAIWRMDYRGGATIFELTRVVPDMGLLVPELAVAFPRGVFFLAEDGFYVFDYNAATPIGKDRMNQAFLDDYDRDYPDRVWAIDDPDSTRIWVVYPGAGNSSGRPNKALVWDWALDLFTTGEFDMEMPAHILPGGITLDTLPDDNLDTFEPTTSFDARQSAAGARALGGYGTDFKPKTFTGAALVGVLDTGVVELAPGRRACTSYVKPLVTGNDHISVAVAGLHEINSPIEYKKAVQKDAEGNCPFRLDARYHSFRLTLGETGFVGFDDAVALDVYFSPTSIR